MTSKSPNYYDIVVVDYRGSVPLPSKGKVSPEKSKNELPTKQMFLLLLVWWHMVQRETVQTAGGWKSQRMRPLGYLPEKLFNSPSNVPYSQ